MRTVPSGTTDPRAPWRHRLHEVIFEADTPAGKLFDVGLLLTIGASVLVVMLESVPSISARHGPLLRAVEWLFTLAFTVEYVLRWLSLGRPWRYALSFFGVVDLLAILPTYVSLVLPGSQSLLVIRALRLLRVFRVLKLTHFLGEAANLRAALRASSRKIIVFLGVVLTADIILGAAMYLIEGPASGFTSVPQGMYWAIVTLTTVGYGDIAPQTVAGKLLASLVMVLGYGIIAVPTGIVSAELVHQKTTTTQACPQCGCEGHERDARFCRACGEGL